MAAPLALDGTALVTLAPNLNVKRRLLQNAGAEDAYYSNDASLSKAQVLEQGIVLPGGVYATLAFCETETAPGEATYWTTASEKTTEIRILDTK